MGDIRCPSFYRWIVIPPSTWYILHAPSLQNMRNNGRNLDERNLILSLKVNRVMMEPLHSSPSSHCQIFLTVEVVSNAQPIKGLNVSITTLNKLCALVMLNPVPLTKDVFFLQPVFEGFPL